MFVNKKSVAVLVEFAMTKLGEAPIDEQIKLYQALGDAMPTRNERAAAREIAKTLSKASALQLDFSTQLFKEVKRVSRNGGGNGGAA